MADVRTVKVPVTLKLDGARLHTALASLAFHNLLLGTKWTLTVYQEGQKGDDDDCDGDDPHDFPGKTKIKKNTTTSEPGMAKDEGGCIGVIIGGGDGTDEEAASLAAKNMRRRTITIPRELDFAGLSLGRARFRLARYNLRHGTHLKLRTFSIPPSSAKRNAPQDPDCLGTEITTSSTGIFRNTVTSEVGRTKDEGGCIGVIINSGPPPEGRVTASGRSKKSAKKGRRSR